MVCKAEVPDVVVSWCVDAVGCVNYTTVLGTEGLFKRAFSLGPPCSSNKNTYAP